MQTVRANIAAPPAVAAEGAPRSERAERAGPRVVPKRVSRCWEVMIILIKGALEIDFPSLANGPNGIGVEKAKAQLEAYIKGQDIWDTVYGGEWPKAKTIWTWIKQEMELFKKQPTYVPRTQRAPRRARCACARGSRRYTN